MSRANAGGTSDSSTIHGSSLRRPSVHAVARRNQGPAAAASGTPVAEQSATTGVELHDGGPEAAGVGTVRLAVSLIARAILFAILGMLVWGLLPFALGWSPTTVMTGSMEPRISAGDVVVSRPVPTGTAELGQILLVDDPDHAGKLRLHRYAEDAPAGGLILRGDANQSNDSSPVSPEAVHGVAVLRVPYVGLPIVWIAEKNWRNLTAVFVAVASLTLAAASGSSRAPGGSRDSAKTAGTLGGQACSARPATRRHLRRIVRRARTIKVFLSLAALPVLVAPGLLMASPSQAAFSASTTPEASSFTAEGSFPCLNRPVQDNPSLFFGFNESSGTTAEDTSGNKLDGNLQGAAARVAGSCGVNDSPALRLNGSTSYVSTPTRLSSAPNTFSLEIWFKAQPGKSGRLMGLGDLQTGASNVTDRNLYVTEAGAVKFGIDPVWSNVASIITSGNGYNNGVWHQAAVRVSTSWDYDPTTRMLLLPGMYLFMDGQLVDYQVGATAAPSFAGYWRVGYDTMNTSSATWPGAPGSLSFDGTIDNAAVYDAALRPSQIRAHFDAGR